MNNETDDVIAERLKKLKGDTNESSASSNFPKIIPKISATEQVENLLDQLTNENRLDASTVNDDVDDLIRRRLEKLKEFSAQIPASEMSELNKNMTNVVLKEIDDELVDGGYDEILSDNDSNDDDSDTPLCTFCSEFALLKCIRCKREYVFCNKCFNEFHEDKDKTKHVMRFLK